MIPTTRYWTNTNLSVSIGSSWIPTDPSGWNIRNLPIRSACEEIKGRVLYFPLVMSRYSPSPPPRILCFPFTFVYLDTFAAAAFYVGLVLPQHHVWLALDAGERRSPSTQICTKAETNDGTQGERGNYPIPGNCCGAVWVHGMSCAFSQARFGYSRSVLAESPLLRASGGLLLAFLVLLCAESMCWERCRTNSGKGFGLSWAGNEREKEIGLVMWFVLENVSVTENRSARQRSAVEASSHFGYPSGLGRVQSDFVREEQKSVRRTG